jgi:hypothetical protein
MFDWLFGNKFRRDIEKVSEDAVYEYFESTEFENMMNETMANTFEQMSNDPKYINQKDFLVEKAKIARSLIKR